MRVFAFFLMGVFSFFPAVFAASLKLAYNPFLS